MNGEGNCIGIRGFGTSGIRVLMLISKGLPSILKKNHRRVEALSDSAEGVGDFGVPFNTRPLND